GDGIQAMKAGLMEVADLFAINKSDRPGADRLAREVAMMLHLRAGEALRDVPAHHGVDMKRAARRISGATHRARRMEEAGRQGRQAEPTPAVTRPDRPDGPGGPGGPPPPPRGIPPPPTHPHQEKGGPGLAGGP